MRQFDFGRDRISHLDSSDYLFPPVTTRTSDRGALHIVIRSIPENDRCPAELVRCETEQGDHPVPVGCLAHIRRREASDDTEGGHLTLQRGNEVNR